MLGEIQIQRVGVETVESAAAEWSPWHQSTRQITCSLRPRRPSSWRSPMDRLSKGKPRWTRRTAEGFKRRNQSRRGETDKGLFARRAAEGDQQDGAGKL